MAANLIIYGSPLSPFQRKVEAIMGVKELEYETKAVNLGNLPDWYNELNPLGSIPTLRDTDIAGDGSMGTIPDSSAMCAYLEKKYAKPAVYPSDPFRYGRALWIEEFADTAMARAGGLGLFRPIAFALFSGKEPDLATARKTWTEDLPPLFDYLEGQLDGGEWFIGDRLTIADIAVACQMMQTDMLVGPPDAEKWPALVDLLTRMKAHAAFQTNLGACEKILGKVMPEKYDLNG